MVDIEVDPSDFFFFIAFPIGSRRIKGGVDLFYRWSLLNREGVSGVFLNINNREMRDFQPFGDSLVDAVVEEVQAVGRMTTFGDVGSVDGDNLLGAVTLASLAKYQIA